MQTFANPSFEPLLFWHKPTFIHYCQHHLSLPIWCILSIVNIGPNRLLEVALFLNKDIIAVGSSHRLLVGMVTPIVLPFKNGLSFTETIIFSIYSKYTTHAEFLLQI